MIHNIGQIEIVNEKEEEKVPETPTRESKTVQTSPKNSFREEIKGPKYKIGKWDFKTQEDVKSAFTFDECIGEEMVEIMYSK